jgi:hypothetical protein
LLLAWIDSSKFARHKTIMHGINAVEYTALVAVPWLMFHNGWLIAALLFERLLVFNIALSLLRKLKWYYVSPERKAITDRIAFFFFRYHGKLMYSVYAACLVGLLVKIFFQHLLI